MSARLWPDRLWIRAILARAAVFWICARGVAAVVQLRVGRPPFDLTPVQAAWLVAGVVALVAAESRRRREHLLLANLGHGPAPVLLLGAIPPSVLEVLIAIGPGR